MSYGVTLRLDVFYVYYYSSIVDYSKVRVCDDFRNVVRSDSVGSIYIDRVRTQGLIFDSDLTNSFEINE